MGKRAKRTSLTRSQFLRRRLKNFIHGLTGRDVFYRVEVKCAREPHGKLSGGWQICPTILPERPLVYSVGVGFDLSFDESFLGKYPGAQLHAFDPTPPSVDWVATQTLDSRLHFHPCGLAGKDGSIVLHAPHKTELSYSIVQRENPIGESFEVPVKRLATLMRELNHDHVDILKMDIEGAEYEVIEDMLQSGIRPPQVLIEFHHRFKGIGNEATRDAVRLLRAAGYRIFYVSHTAREYGFILESALAGNK